MVYERSFILNMAIYEGIHHQLSWESMALLREADG